MHRQRGVALLVCLMLLLIISVLGISALRMSLGQTEIAASTIASNMGFHAAETGINKVISEVEASSTGRDMLPTTTAPVYRCVSATDSDTASNSTSDCTAAMDSKGALEANVRIDLLDAVDESDADAGTKALLYRVQQGGGPGLVLKKFRLTSSGKVDAMNIETINVQETVLPYREL